MSIYSGLTDEELLADITAYRAARRDLMLGERVVSIAGEGRRVEFTKSSSGALDGELKSLIAEAQLRGLIPPTTRGGAINVEFC